jgi:hypothetical protein
MWVIETLLSLLGMNTTFSGLRFPLSVMLHILASATTCSNALNYRLRFASLHQLGPGAGGCWARPTIAGHQGDNNACMSKRRSQEIWKFVKPEHEPQLLLLLLRPRRPSVRPSSSHLRLNHEGLAEISLPFVSSSTLTKFISTVNSQTQRSTPLQLQLQLQNHGTIHHSPHFLGGSRLHQPIHGTFPLELSTYHWL